MLKEVTRIVADWLEDPTYGVNSKLAALQLDDGDDPSPLIEKVLDPTRDDTATGGSSEPDWPVLVVSVDEPASMEVGEESQLLLDAEVAVTIRLLTAEPSSARATQRTLDYLRAVHQSISELMTQANNANRQRDGIDVLFAVSREWGEVEAVNEFEQGRVTGAYVVLFRVRDTEPRG
jgi:hypothetical protein